MSKSNFSPETLDFLKKEAKNCFDTLNPIDKQIYGDWRGLFRFMKKNWRAGIKLPKQEIRGAKESHRKNVEDIVIKATTKPSKWDRFKEKVGIG